MQKITLRIVIGLTSLLIMACGFGGFAQQKIETQANELEPAPESQPVAEIEVQKEIVNTPIPTVDPLDAAKSCLAKTWEINGLGDYVIAAIPPELAAEYGLAYVGTSGGASLTLSDDGYALLQANQLEFLFNAQVNILKVPVTVRVDGTAVGTYTANLKTVTIDHMETSGLTASAQALGQDLMEPDQIIASIPFVRPPYNTAEYRCQGNTLEVKLSGYPEDMPPLIFQAVK